MLLTADVIASLQLARVLPPTIPSTSTHSPSPSSSPAFLSLDFDSSGEWAAACTSDVLHLLSVDGGSLSKAVVCRALGLRHVRFTHHAKAVLVAAHNQPSLRYLSLHDNRCLRAFAGHTAALTSVAVSPVDDSALSAAHDRSVRLWDLRVAGAKGVIRLGEAEGGGDAGGGWPSVAFDPQGLIFAVTVREGRGGGAAQQVVKLYDQRSYSAGPFSTFVLDAAILAPSPSSLSSSSPSPSSPSPHVAVVHAMQFAPDGQTLLLSSNTSRHVLLDAFDGHVRRIYQAPSSSSPPSYLPLTAAFSPDAQWVLAGSDDGAVHVYEREGEHGTADPAGPDHPTGVAVEPRYTLHGRHKEPIRCLSMSPSRVVLLTAATELGFWLPPRDLIPHSDSI